MVEKQQDVTNNMLEKLSREEYVDLLGMPKYSTRRQCELKMAQIELETKWRKDNEHKIIMLEDLLRRETENFITLKKTMERDLEGKRDKEKAMSNNIRNASFHEEKVNKKINKLDKLDLDIKLALHDVMRKRDELENLEKSLEEFQNLEPTNEALRGKIDELKKSRLSLEMTFVDESDSTTQIRL